jgi:hypothetical protein
MWINEGFAKYGEYLCIEVLDPTLEKYKTGIRSLHFGVLRNEKGLYALNNVPINDTYNTNIVYNKGGLVAYTLRNYMGDEEYFSSITQFLDENQYKNIDSEEFFKQLEKNSGIDLTDFYLGWVDQPGMLNFNIDSITPVAGTNNKYDLSFKQKLYYAQYFADNNKVDVEFYSNSGDRHLIKNIRFSGENEMVQVEIPFEPVFWSIDPNGKMGDACFDYTQQVVKTGPVSLSDGNFRIDVTEISDTSIIRVEHNPVAPTSPKNNHPNIVKISEKHFWRVGFIQYNNMTAKYSFTYDKSKYDGELLQGYTTNDLVLLYRKDASHDWQIIPTTDTALNVTTGRLSVNSILAGEYAFGIGKDVKVQEWENSIEVYPNPTTGELRITNYELRITSVEIYDVYGKRQKVESRRQKVESETVIDASNLPSGIYILEIISKENKIYKKIIKL